MKALKIPSLALALCLLFTAVFPVAAAAEGEGGATPEIPSLQDTFEGELVLGTLEGVGEAPADSPEGQIQRHHVSSFNLGEELNLYSLFDKEASRGQYGEIAPEGFETEEEYLAALDAANRAVVLLPLPAELQAVLEEARRWNSEQSDPADYIRVRGGALLGHLLADEAFFREGFGEGEAGYVAPDVMLDRMNAFIGQALELFAPYSDVITQWDVTDEAVSEAGEIFGVLPGGTANLYQLVFGAPEGVAGTEKLEHEALYVRKAFEFARAHSNRLGAAWKLYYQSDYAAGAGRRSAVYNVLRPVFEAGNIDGIGLGGIVVGETPMADVTETLALFGGVCAELSITGASPAAAPAGEPDVAAASFGAYGWGSEASQMWRADALADFIDYILENSTGNGGKVVQFIFESIIDALYDYEGGQPGMSYYAVLGCAARLDLRKQLAASPGEEEGDSYSALAWEAYLAALAQAKAVLAQRIYTMAGVDAVKAAAAALAEALRRLEEGYPLEAVSDKALVKSGEFFNVSVAFTEVAPTNTASLVLLYDAAVFEYRGFTPADGLAALKIENGEGRLTVILGNTAEYAMEALGVIQLSVREDAVLANEDFTMDVAADYVCTKPGGDKLVFRSETAFEISTTRLGEVMTLLDLSDIIDLFGARRGDEQWSVAKYYDFNGNGEIDINDVSYVAARITL